MCVCVCAYVCVCVLPVCMFVHTSASDSVVVYISSEVSTFLPCLSCLDLFPNFMSLFYV